MIKMMICGRRRKDLTLAEHREHMKDIHGRLVLDYIAAFPDQAPRRYVQNHTFDGIYPGGASMPPAFAMGLDFVTEVWAPDLASLKASRETEFYNTHLKPDEQLMVDTDTVFGMPCAEEICIPVQEGGTAFKVFLAWHGTAPDDEGLATAVAKCRHQLLGHFRNTALVPVPVQVIEEFWLASEEDAIDLAQTCRDVIRPQTGTFTLTVAREFILHAGSTQATTGQI